MLTSDDLLMMSAMMHCELVRKKGFNQHISSLISHVDSMCFSIFHIDCLLVDLEIQSLEIMTVMLIQGHYASLYKNKAEPENN